MTEMATANHGEHGPESATNPAARLRDPTLIALLRSLPDPGEPLKGGIRAGENRARLDDLAGCGLAENRRGWWRKSRGGVLFLRSDPNPG